MAFSTGNSSSGPMADINVTPLVDVMLVLLIIFMITTPLMNHKTKVELPRAFLVTDLLWGPARRRRRRGAPHHQQTVSLVVHRPGHRR